jgi:hypothetical protein
VCSDASFNTLIIANSSGARPALRMGVAPEAIVGKKIGYRLKNNFSLTSSFYFRIKNVLSFTFSSGARPALPIRVVPEAMIGYLVGDHSPWISLSF